MSYGYIVVSAHHYITYIMGKIYRGLTEDEILQLKSQSCLADDWGKVFVAEDFTTEYVHHTRFSGEVKLGVFQSDFTLPGGIKKHAGQETPDHLHRQ